MATSARQPNTSPEAETDPQIVIVSDEEWRRMFDEAALLWTGMSGDEFIRRWEAGELADIPDDEAHRRWVDLVLMMPIDKQRS